MFFGIKLIEYHASFDDLLILWRFYSLTAYHYINLSKVKQFGIQKKLSKFLENFAVVRIDELSAGRDVARYHINAVSTLLQTDIGMTSLCIACALFWLNPEC